MLTGLWLLGDSVELHEKKTEVAPGHQACHSKGKKVINKWFMSKPAHCNIGFDFHSTLLLLTHKNPDQAEKQVICR